MRLADFNVPADVKRHLSPATLADVIQQFHPDGECYVCHRPLGKVGRFSLRVDENGPVAVVLPAHAPCHSSSASSVTAVGVPEGTYRTLPVGLPVESGGRQTSLPLLLVNPSIDVVTLTRGESGHLIDNRDSTLLSVGWAKYSPDVPFRGNSEAVGTASRPALGGDWMVSTLLGTWSANFPPQVEQAIQEFGSLFVMVLYTTSVVDLFSADDPYSAIRAAIVDEPALFGRCTFERGRSR